MANFLRVCCLSWVFLAPAPCFADSIFLNAEGQKHLDVLRLRVLPGIVQQHPQRGVPFIRCVIVGERAARDVKAPYMSVEGSPEYDIVAFDATGDRRSAPVPISRAWIEFIEPDFDSDLDIRSLFSNRDERAGVALGSRAYFAMVRRAADPKGTLGLWQNDMSLPPEPKGVQEGGIVRFLLDPPMDNGWSARWQARRTATIKEGLAKRLPMEHRLTWDLRPSLVAPRLVVAVARERAYRLSRTGFDRTALAMLIFMLDLAVVGHGGDLSAPTRANSIGGEGRASVTDAIHLIQNATLPETGLECGAPTLFCPDRSQQTVVAIEALMASEGLFATPAYAEVLARAVLHVHVPANAASLQRGKADVRGPAMKLLVHALKPPKGRDAASEKRRRAYADAVREQLHVTLLDVDRAPGQQATARRALAAGGWGSAAQLQELANGLFNTATGFSGRAHRATTNSEREQWRQMAVEYIVSLRALAELGASQVPAEKQAAQAVLQRVAELRKTMKGPTADGSERIFLAIWDSPASRPASR